MIILSNYRQDFSLTVCFRCPKRHLALANRIVPDIQALEDASEGVVRDNVSLLELLNAVEAQHLVMARSNAALVKIAFDIVKRGGSAKIIGEDILREKLEDTLKRFAGKSNRDALSALKAEKDEEHRKLVLPASLSRWACASSADGNT